MMMYGTMDRKVRQSILYDQFKFVPDHLLYERFPNDPEVLIHLAATSEDPDILREVFNKGDLTTKQRVGMNAYWFLAINNDTPEDVLLDLVNLDDPNADYAIACRKDLPESAVSILRARYANSSDEDSVDIMRSLDMYYN